jgi:predicted DNA-binding transcriptional regulator YafY
MRIISRPPLERFAIIDQAIRSHKWPNAHKLAKTLEVTVRTVRRDLRFLRDRLHAPIAYDASHQGFYYTDDHFTLPGLAITEGEYLALFLAERLLQQYRGTSFAGDIGRLFRKVTDRMTESITIDLSQLHESVSFRQQATDASDVKVFEQLHCAVRQGRRLEMVYWTASRNETGCRVIDPYHLASIDGDWLLVAHCHRREDVLMFALSRIRELHETGDTFDRPTDFCINNYLDVGFRKYRGVGPPQTVRLRFAGQVAHLIREKEWHPTQKLREHTDGSLTLSFRVNHLLEVKRWVLSFGADCEVLGPKERSEQIYREAKRMLGE